MAQKKTESKTAERSLEVLGCNEKEKTFQIKDVASGHICTIDDTFAEMFRLIVTACSVLGNSPFL